MYIRYLLDLKLKDTYGPKVDNNNEIMNELKNQLSSEKNKMYSLK